MLMDIILLEQAQRVNFLVASTLLHLVEASVRTIGSKSYLLPPVLVEAKYELLLSFIFPLLSCSFYFPFYPQQQDKSPVPCQWTSSVM